MSYYVYILKCDNNYYTGFTNNLKRRLLEHKKGINSFVKNKKSVKLIFYSCFPNKNLAVSFEKYLKSHSGRAFREKHLIKHSLPGEVPKGTKTGGSSSVG